VLRDALAEFHTDLGQLAGTMAATDASLVQEKAAHRTSLRSLAAAVAREEQREAQLYATAAELKVTAAAMTAAEVGGGGDSSTTA
jgi:hypothetical protein